MSRLPLPPRQTVQTLLLALCVVTAVVVVPLGTASAQSQPGAPANFYGTITDGDGTPAPAGTEVFAVVNGSVEDSLVINEAGQYGGPGGFDEKLTVNTGAGEEVVFTVGTPDGPQAAESPVAFASLDADPVEQNLTFPAGTFATVEAVDLELNSTSIEIDAATTATVTATYSNDTTRDVTGQATLASDTPEVAAANGSTITGLAEGTANITATVGGVEETVSLTVTAPPTTNVGGGGGGGGGGTEPSEPFFAVTTLDPPSQTATVGDRVTVGATITNTGGLAETQQITLELADETVAEQSLQLRGDGANATVRFTEISTDELSTGEYTYRVVTADETEAGTLTLTAPSDGDDDGSDGDGTDGDGTDGDDGDVGDGADGDGGDGTGDDTGGGDGGDGGDGGASDDSTPGFGILAAVVALLAAAGVASRQR